jgi:purine-binding chemotaxis protein CheW
MIEKQKKTYLTFKLYKELFAINVLNVLEVLQEYNVVELPDAPKYITGMINFRNDIIPLINFREKFMFPENKPDKNKIIVISITIDDNSIKFGAIVDRVNDVFEIDKDEIKDTPEFGSKYNPEYLNGMIFKNNKHFMLLNLEKVFTNEEIELVSKL